MCGVICLLFGNHCAIDRAVRAYVQIAADKATIACVASRRVASYQRRQKYNSTKPTMTDQ